MTDRRLQAVVGLSVAVLGIVVLQKAAARDARTLGLAAPAVPVLVTAAGVLMASRKLSQIGGRH